jgi:hypothetical protein
VGKKGNRSDGEKEKLRKMHDLAQMIEKKTESEINGKVALMNFRAVS